IIGSNANGCSDTAYVTITILEPVIPDAGPDLTGTCTQDSISLSAILPAQGTGLWSILSGAGGSFDDSSSPASLFRGTAGETYSLAWPVTTHACVASSDSMQVHFIKEVTTPQLPGGSACAPADGNTALITLTATGSEGTYSWYSDPGLTGAVVSTDSVYFASV